MPTPEGPKNLEDKILNEATVLEEKDVDEKEIASAKERALKTAKQDQEKLHSAIDRKIATGKLNQKTIEGLKNLQSALPKPTEVKPQADKPAEPKQNAPANAPDKGKKFMDDVKELFTNDSKTSVGKRIGNTFNSFADWMMDNKIVNWLKDKLRFGKK